MAKYRKKPIVIEAIQLTKETLHQVLDFVTCDCLPGKDGGGDPILIIETLEGDMTAHAGDWIIKGVKNEFYPCRDDIFNATYELVEGEKDIILSVLARAGI